MTSYALNALDSKMSKYLPEGGFFIEAGANDGVSQSNTLMYEERGWKGLLIEPNPVKYNSCKINRPSAIVENCALVSDEYPEQTIKGYFSHTQYAESLMATIEGIKGSIEHSDDALIEVPARTLASILEQHNIEKIDWLSLDVEGYEIQVLKGLNLKKHRPRVILIELWDHQYENVKKFLEEAGYEQIDKLSYHDYLFSDTIQAP